MSKKIYISGVHSGQNPCAGVGIARSLRKAFPDVTLVAVDHWQGSSGLHHEAMNETLLLPQWKQIDRVRHVEFLDKILKTGNIWISALDVEVYWLAQNYGAHQNLLVPTGTALEMTAKPNVQAFSDLGFSIPEHVPAFSSDSDVHSFLRQNSWQCWLKSPYHDAKRITSWDSFENHRDKMQNDWKSSRLFLQKHIVGNEESAISQTWTGLGFVIVSGPHPEAPVSWQYDSGVDPDGTDHDLAIKLIHSALYRQPMPVY